MPQPRVVQLWAWCNENLCSSEAEHWTFVRYRSSVIHFAFFIFCLTGSAWYSFLQNCKSSFSIEKKKKSKFYVLFLVHYQIYQIWAISKGHFTYGLPYGYYIFLFFNCVIRFQWKTYFCPPGRVILGLNHPVYLKNNYIRVLTSIFIVLIPLSWNFT